MEDKKRKHNYPKTRKPRTTEYAVSTQISNALGLDHICQVWQELGMYKASKQLSEEWGYYCSPFVLRAMSHKYNWTRIVTDPRLAISIAHIRKSVPDGYYKHIIFEIER